jgi:uncharacterized protein YdeI (YjbR/CyaY-like superfamily)
VALARGGGKTRRTPPGTKPPLAMPDDLQAALADVPAAAAGFAALPPGARREYIEWVASAKQPATRAKRLVTTVEQAAAGRKLHWKYENC